MKLNKKIFTSTIVALTLAGVVVPAATVNAESITEKQMDQGQKNAEKTAKDVNKQGFASGNQNTVIKLGHKRAAKVLKSSKTRSKKVHLLTQHLIYSNAKLSYAKANSTNYTGKTFYVSKKEKVRTRTGHNALYYYVHNNQQHGWIWQGAVKVN